MGTQHSFEGGSCSEEIPARARLSLSFSRKKQSTLKTRRGPLFLRALPPDRLSSSHQCRLHPLRRPSVTARKYSSASGKSRERPAAGLHQRRGRSEFQLEPASRTCSPPCSLLPVIFLIFSALEFRRLVRAPDSCDLNFDDPNCNLRASNVFCLFRVHDKINPTCLLHTCIVGIYIGFTRQ